ncbi:MAG: maleylpyruvate isomerase family mycothiol-dependent enzyme [Acidimicrobiales bacterium]
MDVADYIEIVASEGDRFATAAGHGELNVDVPTCDGWDMRQLVQHVGLIHLWAAANVASPSDSWLQVDDLAVLADHWPDLASSWPDDADLISWYRQTNANLVRVLESAPADVECFTFLPAPTPLTMWARRQAAEIAIHRFDAEISHGITSHFDQRFSADMLDELLVGFAPLQTRLAGRVEQVLHVHANDVDEHWYVRIGMHDIKTSREGYNADLTATGTAADLNLFLWNRTRHSNVTLTGNTDLMDTWRSGHRVEWRGGRGPESNKQAV